MIYSCLNTGSEKSSSTVKNVLDISAEWIQNHLWFQWIVFALVAYIFLTAAIHLILKDGHDLKKKNWFNIGYRTVKYILRLDVLLAIILLSVPVLIVHCINLGDKGNVELTTLTISFTLAAIIPYIIGRTIAKNEVDNIVELKFNKRFESVAESYNTSINSLRRSNAHYRRIAASLLSNQTEKDCEWAIGWAAEAILSYLLINETYPKGKEYAIECAKTIRKSFDKVNKNDIGSYADKDIHERTLRSVLTMHAYRSIRKLNGFGEIEDTELTDIESKLWKSHRNTYKEIEVKAIKEKLVSECKVTDLNDEDLAKEIQKKVMNIIDCIIEKGNI